ncbi:MAG: hypothetical protein R6V44_17530 [Paracoccaceae bacterium]
MFEFIIELVGLFSAAVASRLFWLRRDEWQPAEGETPGPLAKARLGIDAVMVAAWLALIVYSKWVMIWWLAGAVILVFTTAAWVGITSRSRDQFEPAGPVFSLITIACALYLWLA